MFTRYVATTTAFARTNLISVSVILGYFCVYGTATEITVFLIYFYNFLTTRRLLISCHHIKFSLLYLYLQLCQSWCFYPHLHDCLVNRMHYVV